MRERGIALLLALASLAAFYGLWLRPAPSLDPDADAARPTTAERRGNGYAGLFEWLRSSGVEVRSFRERYSGLTELEAKDAGFDAFAIAIDGTTRAAYYPDAAPIRVKLVTELGTGQLLGAQIIGEEGAAKRIDVLAACIWNEMTVDQSRVDRGLLLASVGQEVRDHLGAIRLFDGELERSAGIASQLRRARLFLSPPAWRYPVSSPSSSS